MSMSLTAQVMSLKVGNAIRKLVLMKLADQANDKGECWPSYSSVAEAAECSRQTAITHIEWLAAHGFLWIEERKIDGRQNLTNVYHLTLENGRAEGYENVLPPSQTVLPPSQTVLPPSQTVLPPSQTVLPGVVKQLDPNQSIQPINEPISANADTRDARHSSVKQPDSANLADRPSETPPAKSAKRQPSAARKELDALNLLADRGVDGALAQDYMAVRKDKRAITLTKTALAGLEREANRAGLSLAQAITLCCERGWVGFRADWLQDKHSRERAAGNGHTSHFFGQEYFDQADYGDEIGEIR